MGLTRLNKAEGRHLELTTGIHYLPASLLPPSSYLSAACYPTMPPTIIDLTQASSPAPAEPEIPSVAVLLKNAIAEAQSSRVRSILVAICDTSPEAARIAANHLLVSEDNIRYLSAEETSEEEEQEEDNEDDEDDAGGRSDRNDEGSSHDDTNKSRKETSGGSHTKGLAVNDVKRMRTRYAMCVNCNEEFEVADNVMGSCCWHDGEVARDLMISSTLPRCTWLIVE